jgi:hypothetical protein
MRTLFVKVARQPVAVLALCTAAIHGAEMKAGIA